MTKCDICVLSIQPKDLRYVVEAGRALDEMFVFETNTIARQDTERAIKYSGLKRQYHHGVRHCPHDPRTHHSRDATAPHASHLEPLPQTWVKVLPLNMHV
jgi:hypothetical protein